MEKKWYSLQELCEVLSISKETGRNWIRTEKIKADKEVEGKQWFSPQTVRQIQKNLQTEKGTRLKSRRNKLYIQGKETYRDYLPGTSENLVPILEMLKEFQEKKLEREDITALLAECALQLLYQSRGKDLGDCQDLIEDLYPSSEKATALHKVQYILEPEVDVLGFLYLSLRHAGEKKVTGAYYTPTVIVQKTIQSLAAAGKLEEGKTILDPCCGSGNFLIQFPESVNPRDIYGTDIDELSVKLTRINLAIKYPKIPAAVWKDHIKKQDFLLEEQQEYDCILGNPPWGYEFSKQYYERLKEGYKTASQKKAESYDIFLEQAVRRVKKGGTVVFVLPEAILYVKFHQKIREILMECTDVKELDYLGEVFHGVQCPSVILNIQKTGDPLNTKGMKVSCGEDMFWIQQERKIEKECFSFHIKDKEYEILQKLEKNPHMHFLKGYADFALGIVTGNNGKYISNEKTIGAEIVLKGTDITKYRINPSEQYLIFQPDKFHQTAHEQYYRNPEKLLYRFIGKELVFARDTQKYLSLNSCNILIPHLEGVRTSYVLAVLNSKTAQFVFQKKFRSVKVLRSHIEQIPIPPASQEQQEELEYLVKELEHSLDENQRKALYEQIDKKIAILSGLTEEEYKIIFPERYL